MLKLNQTAHSVDIIVVIIIKYICYFNWRHPVVFEFKSKTKCFKVTIKTQQHCINISILLWQHVLVLLDHLQASIQRYEVQSVHIMYYGIPYYLQGVHKNSLKL